MGYRITDDIEELKAVLPEYLLKAIERYGHEDELIEIILDLGRIPTARYVTAEITLDKSEIQQNHIDYVVSRIREFDTDNRAGIERTLHRISAIRNRRGDIVGLTCRIGRAVYGTIEIIQDIIASGKSVLMLGPPGVGKTTMLREAARVLADNRRVVIVDTSNEIGGDGDVPHPAVGRARRMQVAQPNLQHEVMIEAVENHNPETIIIDEIGRELEAQAARTIAERGVQLIGTAHGNTLDNLLMNPTLSDLVGGIESVTLSDDEARRRGTQKTVLERRSPPTFDVLIEIQDRNRLIVHGDVASAVDALLRSHPLPAELRIRESDGHIRYETVTPFRTSRTGDEQGQVITPEKHSGRVRARNGKRNRRENGESAEQNGQSLKTIKVYVYGIARDRLRQSARRLNVPLEIVDDLREADAVVTMKTYYRQRPRLIVDAERDGISIYVLRANSVTQMEDFLIDAFHLDTETDTGFEGTGSNGQDEYAEAVKEAEEAVRQVQISSRPYVDLKPRSASLRRRQHELARRAQLISHSYGTEPYRYVRVLQPESSK